MSAVFVNYRVGDGALVANFLHRGLARAFGEHEVFFASVRLDAGDFFDQEILNHVRSCRVLIAVIGPHWLSATSADGRRRLDDEKDWVRREIAMALREGIRVVPVLIEGARMPAAQELPPDLLDLARCNYLRLGHRRGDTDVVSLVQRLREADPQLPLQPSSGEASAAFHREPGELPFERVRLHLHRRVIGARRSSSRPTIAALASGVGFVSSAGWWITSGSRIALALGMLSILPLATTLAVRRYRPIGDHELVAIARYLADAVDVSERTQQDKLLGDSGQARPADIEFNRSLNGYWRSDGGRDRGTLAEIAEFYANLRWGRLVIVGPAGAGKTVLANQLLLDLIQFHRQIGDPPPGEVPQIPVRLGLRTFNPGSNPELVDGAEAAARLDAWICRQIAAAYGLARHLASELVRRGCILPILDGLDEMDPGSSRPVAAALVARALNHPTAHGMRPVVVTCRTTRLNELLDQAAPASQPTALQDATAVELEPLDAAQVSEYLHYRFPDPANPADAQARWQPVLEHLGTAPTGTLAQTLGSPLKLYLTVTAYHSPRRDPSDLIGLSTEELSRHLFDQLIPTAVEEHPRPNGRHYNPAEVRNWLTELIYRIETPVDRQSRDTAQTPGGIRSNVGSSYFLRAIAASAFVLLFMIPYTLTIRTSAAYSRQKPASLLRDAASVAALTSLEWCFAWLLARRWEVVKRSPNSPRRFKRTTRIKDVIGIILSDLVNVFLLVTFIALGAYPIFSRIDDRYTGSQFEVSFLLTLSIYESIRLRARSNAVNIGRLLAQFRYQMYIAVLAFVALAILYALKGDTEVFFACLFTLMVAVVFPLASLDSSINGWTLRRTLPSKIGPFLKWAFDVGLVRVTGDDLEFRHLEVRDYLLKYAPTNDRRRQRRTRFNGHAHSPQKRILIRFVWTITLLTFAIFIVWCTGLRSAPLMAAISIPVVGVFVTDLIRTAHSIPTGRGERWLRFLTEALAQQVYGQTLPKSPERRWAAVLNHIGVGAVDWRKLLAWRSLVTQETMTASNLANYFSRLPTPRLVIRCDQVADADEIVNEFIMGMVEIWRGTKTPEIVRVPIQLDAGDFDSWRASSTDQLVGAQFDAWLTACLTRMFGLPRRYTAELVAARRILPVLNGFDDDQLSGQFSENAEAALRAINFESRTGRPPVVIIYRSKKSRIRETKTTAVRRILDADVVDLVPASAIAVSACLTEIFPDPVDLSRIERRWLHVADELQTNPDGPLAQALNSSLALRICVMAYSPVHTNPSELVGQEASQVREHLAARFFESATTYARENKKRWTVEKIRYWLASTEEILSREYLRGRWTPDGRSHWRRLFAADRIIRSWAAVTLALITVISLYIWWVLLGGSFTSSDPDTEYFVSSSSIGIPSALVAAVIAPCIRRDTRFQMINHFRISNTSYWRLSAGRLSSASLEPTRGGFFGALLGGIAMACSCGVEAVWNRPAFSSYMETSEKSIGIYFIALTVLVIICVCVGTVVGGLCYAIRAFSYLVSMFARQDKFANANHMNWIFDVRLCVILASTSDLIITLTVAIFGDYTSLALVIYSLKLLTIFFLLTICILAADSLWFRWISSSLIFTRQIRLLRSSVDFIEWAQTFDLLRWLKLDPSGTVFRDLG